MAFMSNQDFNNQAEMVNVVSPVKDAGAPVTEIFVPLINAVTKHHQNGVRFYHPVRQYVSRMVPGNEHSERTVLTKLLLDEEASQQEVMSQIALATGAENINIVRKDEQNTPQSVMPSINQLIKHGEDEKPLQDSRIQQALKQEKTMQTALTTGSADILEYKWDQRYLLYWDKEAGQYQELCNFCVYPIRRVTDIYKQQSNQKRIEIKVVFADREELMTVKSTDSGDLIERIKKLFPDAYTSPDASKVNARFTKYFALQVNGIENVLCYHDVGWTKIRNQYRYLYDNMPWQESFICSTGKKLMVNRNLSQQESFMKVLSMLDIAKDKTKILVPWLFMHLGVMHTIFELAGRSPKFLLFIFGGTGTLKTSLSRVLYSMFEGDHEKIPATFKDTKTALEIKMGSVNDGTLLIDDLHPTTSKSEQIAMRDALEFMIRLYGDHVSKSRSGPDLELKKTFTAHGLACITGEYTAGTESSLLRCILIPVKQGDYTGETLASFQADPLILSTHLHYYIKYLEEYFLPIQDTIKLKFDAMRQQLEHRFKAKRLVDAAVQLFLVMEFILEYGKRIGAITVEQSQVMGENWSDVILETVKRSEGSSTTVQPVIMYLSAVNALLDNHSIMVAKSRSEYCDNIRSFIGFYEEDIVFFKPEEIYKAVFAYWRDLQSHFTSSSKDIHSALYEIGATKGQKDGTNKTSYLYRMSGLKIDGQDSRRRMLAIRITNMKKILQHAEDE